MHKCPPWCHRCPLMSTPGGNERWVLPVCDGTAICADGPYDLSRCTCNRPRLREEQKDCQIAALEKRVRQLEAKLSLLAEKE